MDRRGGRKRQIAMLSCLLRKVARNDHIPFLLWPELSHMTSPSCSAIFILVDQGPSSNMFLWEEIMDIRRREQSEPHFNIF